VRERLDRVGSEGSWHELARRDPALAASLKPGDRQRVVRALEVAEATGRPLSHWRALPREGAWPGRVLTLVLDPPRDRLYRRCDRRFGTMLAHGALDEAAAVQGLGLAPELPALKTVGLRDLMAHLRGEIPLAVATARARQATRNYAKRQTTWFRHQLPGAIRLTATSAARLDSQARTAVGRFVELTAPY
jgi:tRNA dimethylallyltransferase